MVPDKVFHDMLDHGQGCLLAFDEIDAGVSSLSSVCYTLFRGNRPSISPFLLYHRLAFY